MGEKKTNIVWSAEEKALLQEFCAKARSWEDLKRLAKDVFPKHPSWPAIDSQARRHTEWVKHFVLSVKIKMPAQLSIVDFLQKPRTLKGIADHFKIPLEEVSVLLKQDFEGMGICVKKNVFGQEIFYLRKKIDLSMDFKRIWTSQTHAEKPYLVINFPVNPKWKKINIIPISDVGFGSLQCEEELLDEYIRWVLSEEQAFAFLNGDILAPVPRRGVPKEEYNPMEHAYRLLDKLAPIAHKILWAQEGDEEEKMYREDGIDPLREVCDILEIPYFSQPVYADVCWSGHIFSFFCFHGRTAALLKGTKLNAVLRPRDFQEHTMFTVMGHAGDGMVKDVIRICQNPTSFKLEEKREYFIICPSFQRYWDSLRAKKGYAPLSRGVISCRLYSDGKYQVSS